MSKSGCLNQHKHVKQDVICSSEKVVTGEILTESPPIHGATMTLSSNNFLHSHGSHKPTFRTHRILLCTFHKDRFTRTTMEIFLGKYFERVISLTGAMYSSVPTKEFDGVTGSAKKIGGGGRFLFLRRLSGISCSTSCTFKPQTMPSGHIDGWHCS